MKTDDIRLWINDPSQLNRESMLQLKSVMEEYPCFTIARMLYLKSLLNLNDLHFSASLIKTAVSVPDRRRLLVRGYVIGRSDRCLTARRRPSHDRAQPAVQDRAGDERTRDR